jgi:hypothetical protein
MKLSSLADVTNYYCLCRNFESCKFHFKDQGNTSLRDFFFFLKLLNECVPRTEFHCQ